MIFQFALPHFLLLSTKYAMVNRLAMANTASKPGGFGVGVGLGIGDGDGVNLVGVTINLSVSSCIFGSSSPSRR